MIEIGDRQCLTCGYQSVDVVPFVDQRVGDRRPVVGLPEVQLQNVPRAVADDRKLRRAVRVERLALYGTGRLCRLLVVSPALGRDGVSDLEIRIGDTVHGHVSHCPHDVILIGFEPASYGRV